MFINATLKTISIIEKSSILDVIHGRENAFEMVNLKEFSTNIPRIRHF